MTDYSPEQAQAAAAEQVAGLADAVQGDPSAAGIYGDPAGRSEQAPAQTPEQLASDLAAKGGTAAAADVDALLAKIQEDAAKIAQLRANLEASQPAAAIPARPPLVAEVVAALSGVAPGIVHALTLIAEHIDGKA